MVPVRILTLFAPQFNAFAVSYFSELKAMCGELSVCGYVKGGERVLKHVESSLMTLGIECELIDYDRWEEDAVTLVKSCVKPMEESLISDGLVSRIIVSDRDLGRCYVSGAVYPNTKLAKLSHLQRLNYVKHQAGHIARTYEVHKFDAVFLYAIAGSLALSLWEHAKSFNVKRYRILHSRIDNIYCISRSLGDEFKVRDVNPSLESRVQARSYLERFYSNGAKPGYALYNHALHARRNKVSRLVTALALDFVRTAYGIVRRRKQSVVKNYPVVASWWSIKYRIQSALDSRLFLNSVPPGKYVLFCLHVEPEASTMVMSPALTNQFAIIESLSKWLPQGCSLVVKEHRPMLGKRPKGFYRQISSLDRTYIVGPLLDSMELIKNSFAVATITGTSAWEAALLGKPVLKFGGSPFDHVSSLIRRVSLEQTYSDVLNDMVREKCRTDSDHVLDYLSHVYEIGAEMDSTALWGDGMAPVTAKNYAGLKKLAEELYLAICDDERECLEV